jgi:hypothetical protein
MKNTPKVGLVSNFWGAVQGASFFCTLKSDVRAAPSSDP